MGISKLSAKQAWAQDWVPGATLANLFNLYPSKGDVTIAAATALPATEDGPGIANRFGTLTVNAALKAAAQRCRFSALLCDYLIMGAAGSMSMTARGAAGSPKWPNQDILIPNNMRLSGKAANYRDFTAWIAANGYAIFDPTLFACPVPGMGDVQANWMEWPGHGASIISASGCGAAQVGSATANTAGITGNAGVLAPGSGGTAFTSSFPGVSAPGRVWGGGPGSGCVLTRTLNEMPDIWGGRGGQGTYSGGAGNPSGNNVDTSKGTGGCLYIFVRYDVVLTAGHLFAADGMPGEDGGGGGAGSGGGRVALYYGGTMTGTPNMSAQGGLGGAPSGGRGGAGATSVNTFLQMGWV